MACLFGREETLDYLAKQVLSYSKLLLMTDYDGTLVPIRERPELALPGPSLLKVLSDLAGKSQVVLAVVSGRDVDELKKMIPVKGIYLAGCHGAEILYPDGEKYTVVEEKKLTPLLKAIANLAQDCISDQGGFLVEKKRAAVALHFRMAEQNAALKVVRDFTAAARPLVIHSCLELTAGKKVIEVRPRGANKGGAVRHLMNLYPAFFPLYLGDDVTDEEAFREVKENGLSVLVSQRRKSTAASYCLKGPHDVLRFTQIISKRFP